MPVASLGRRRAILFLLCLAQLMCILDISIVNIAIPSIQKELGLAPTALQWVMTAYVLTYGGFLLVGGRLGDLYGRRRILYLGLAGFTIASAVGGVSTGAVSLWAARAGQGLGAAVISPTVLSFITSLFPEGRERNHAVSTLAAVTGLGFALGLVLGGILTTAVGWRWVFFINVPIGVAVIAAAMIMLPETERVRQPVDIPGAVLATAGLTVTAYTLSSLEAGSIFSLRTAILAALAIMLFVVLVLVERNSPHPLVPPGLLRHRSLLHAVIGAGVFGSVIGPTGFMLTIYLQDVSRFSPLTTGLSYLPQEAAVLAASYLAGRWVGRRLTSRAVIALGVVAFGSGAWWLAQRLPAGGYWETVLPGLLLMGAAIGLVVVGGSIAATQGLPNLQHGAAAGIFNTSQQIGTAFGLALLTAIATNETSRLLGAVPGLAPDAAMVGGFSTAFAAAVIIALAGLAALFSVGRQASDPRTEP